MNESFEPSFHSAKAFAEFSQKKANDAKKKEAVAKKASQLASEQVALLKESNELAKKALADANLRSEQEGSHTNMNLMISWSKTQSKVVATALHEWLPNVLPGIKPWISSKDIDKGREWFRELQSVLASTKACIICVTGENVRSPWIYYEAGAIAANRPEEVRICPYLINVEQSFLSGGPLAQWQCTNATRDDTWDLVKSLNDSVLSSRHDVNLLKGNYDACWGDYQNKIASLPPAQDIEDTVENPLQSDNPAIDTIGRDHLSGIPKQKEEYTFNEVLNVYVDSKGNRFCPGCLAGKDKAIPVVKSDDYHYKCPACNNEYIDTLKQENCRSQLKEMMRKQNQLHRRPF